ncbi:MAG: replicative DNA helicase [Candidatus Odinarchaeota archaeon]
MYSYEAERSILGCMLIDNYIAIECTELLTEEDFSLKHNKAFKAIKKLIDAEKSVDVVTVSGIVGNIEYLTELATSVPTSQNYKQYIEILVNKKRIRKLHMAATNILSDIKQGEDLDKIISYTEKEIESLNITHDKGLITIEEATDSAIRKIEERYNKKDRYPGVITGFFDIDYKLGGLQRGDLIIIAGRPSMGKTAFAENINAHISIDDGKPTAFFSLEMTKEQIIDRIISSRAGISNEKLRLGDITPHEWSAIIEISEKIKSSPMIIDDTRNQKASDIRNKARRIKKKLGGLDLIVVDHLTEMWRDRKESEKAGHEENVRQMKRLSYEMDCPVILLQQLNRNCEARLNKRPLLSDLKETGASEEVADVAMFIYRDEYYNKDSYDKGIAEINIAKGRNTGTGVIKLGWHGAYTRFVNLEFKR